MTSDIAQTMLNRFKDAEFIQETPAVFKCALQCDFYETTKYDIYELKNSFNSIGMAQLFKKKEGFFVVFVGHGGIYFCTNTGSFRIESGYLSLKCESGLFIFEIAPQHVEEAKCAIMDLMSLIRRSKARREQLRKFQDLCDWFRNVFEDGENNEDDEDDED